MKKLLLVLLFALSGCTTVYNDQSACTTDCNVGSTGYVGAGADIINDQSACTNDCNIGDGIPRQYNWSPNIVYYPYHRNYQRGPVVIYHY